MKRVKSKDFRQPLCLSTTQLCLCDTKVALTIREQVSSAAFPNTASCVETGPGGFGIQAIVGYLLILQHIWHIVGEWMSRIVYQVHALCQALFQAYFRCDISFTKQSSKLRTGNPNLEVKGQRQREALWFLRPFPQLTQ
jgi:hypothetical protein